MHLQNSNGADRNQPRSNFGDFLGELLNKSPTANIVRFPASPQTAPVLASDEAIIFLKGLDLNGRHNLVAIDPEGKIAIEGRTFEEGAWDAIAAWINERDGRLNMYFTVNELKAGARNKKPAKSDIGAVRALCVDADPAELPPGGDLHAHFASERAGLRAKFDDLSKGPCAPSVILDSGGGFQAFWLLADKLPAQDRMEDVEALGRGLGRHVGGDAVQNIDRLMRLPGTLNIPTATKRAKGQVPRRAAVISSGSARYSLETLARHYAPATANPTTDKSPAIAQLMREIDLHAVWAAASFDALPGSLRERFIAARRSLPELDQLWTSGKPEAAKNGGDNSRSAARFQPRDVVESLAVHAG